MKKFLLYVFTLVLGVSFFNLPVYAFPGEQITGLGQPGDYFTSFLGSGSPDYTSLIFDCGTDNGGEYGLMYTEGSVYAVPVNTGGINDYASCNFITPDFVNDIWPNNIVDAIWPDDPVGTFGIKILFVSTTDINCADPGNELSFDDCVVSTTANGVFLTSLSFTFTDNPPGGGGIVSSTAMVAGMFAGFGALLEQSIPFLYILIGVFVAWFFLRSIVVWITKGIKRSGRG